jgi:hypothetical protein
MDSNLCALCTTYTHTQTDFFLCLENFGHAIEDSKNAIKLDESNIKAYYRAAKGSLCLKKLENCLMFCQLGLKVS